MLFYKALTLHWLSNNLTLAAHIFASTVGSFRHHRLIAISNSLSESELQRLKGLVQPKLESFRLAKIREGSELFQELESRGELSCTSVRDLLEKNASVVTIKNLKDTIGGRV